MGVVVHILGLGMEDMAGQGGEVLRGSTVQGIPGLHHCRVWALMNDMPHISMKVITQGAKFAMGSSTEIKGAIRRCYSRAISNSWLPPGGGIGASREG